MEWSDREIQIRNEITSGPGLGIRYASRSAQFDKSLVQESEHRQPSSDPQEAQERLSLLQRTEDGLEALAVPPTEGVRRLLWNQIRDYPVPRWIH